MNTENTDEDFFDLCLSVFICGLLSVAFYLWRYPWP